jgi:short-subunit dehydrogenase
VALVLNAGVGVAGDFVRSTDLIAEIKMIQLNCISTVHLAKRVLPRMVARGRGRVLFTSSIVEPAPAPFEAVYSATRAFVLAFSEAIANELKDTGVTVTVLQPGPTDTNFFRRAGLGDADRAEREDAAEVARQGFDAMMAGKDKVYAGSLATRIMGH